MLRLNRTYELGDNEGDPRLANKKYLIIHDTGNDNNKGAGSGKNEASYMKQHWQDANTHLIVDDVASYIICSPGYVAYGAGQYANENSPMQIELAHVSTQKRFNKSYARYLDAIKYFAKKYKIPLTLDTDKSLPGIKSHAWVSANIWGDHVDPWPYLSKWGVTKAQFIKDLGIKQNKNKNPTYYNYAHQVIAKTTVSRYKDLAFREKVDSYPKGTVFDIWQVVKWDKITRLKLANGLYITANTDYVKRLS